MAQIIDTLYIIHHSHTDIGYTHDQPIVWELYRRFLDEALRLAWADHERDGDDCFRWTAETTAPLLHWLKHASPEDRARLCQLNAAGRIDVGGMFLNITPLYDTTQLIETLRPIEQLRAEYGLRIRHAMNCDVNGQNWPLVDLLLDAGIAGFSMAINEHFGGAPFQRPNAFWWEGPSGRRILAWNGWTYAMGHEIGIGWDVYTLEEQWWPRIQAHLESIAYPLPILMAQMYHPFGDNGSANPRIGPFIAAWNAAGKKPRLRMSTLSEWFDALREYGDRLPTYRGDWTDYWNFGSISSAREQAMNRESRTRLIVADSLRAVAGAFASPSISRDSAAPDADEPAGSDTLGAATLRDEAWRALHLFDEHTWGADVSVRAPESDDTHSQWIHKAAYAAQARSLSLLLQRDGVAFLARRVQRPPEPALLVFNPLPWSRRVAAVAPQRILDPRGGGEDPTAARHFQDRAQGLATRLLPPTEIPGFGYRLVRVADLLEAGEQLGMPESDFEGEMVVENQRHRLTFDAARGGVSSWWDKRLQRELIDQGAGWPLGGFVYETMVEQAHPWPRRLLWRRPPIEGRLEPPRGWRPGWGARRSGPQRLLSHRVWRTPLGIEIEQMLAVDALPEPVRLRFRLPSYAEHVECEASWTMSLATHPEATYLAFPLAVPGAVCHLDLGGQAMQPERDQIPGSCRDYYTVQRWVDCSNEEFGVTAACPLNPMVQLGDFRFGANLAEHTLPRSLLLGWATNNYWETNFRAHQPGQVRARYWLLSHAGGFDGAAAHRFGMEAACPPILQSLGERPATANSLPGEATLLRLSEPPVLVLHARDGHQPGTMLVTLAQTAEAGGPAVIAPGALRFTGAYQCDILGKPQHELPLEDAALHLSLAPHEVTTVCLVGLGT